jgi:hypothetical protein
MEGRESAAEHEYGGDQDEKQANPGAGGGGGRGGVGVGIGERIGFQGDWRWAAARRSLAKALCRGQGSCRLPGVLARSWPVGPLSSPDSDGVRGHQADIIATARLTAVAVCKDR